ncbi:hypothetical protein QA640_43430 [Bradyrhizobium sp. CB82]|uniref:hypothetical protein n=1 Tax=Bradyrhizobium sp. CB82 TaxID=3039159 RepID=UPI0024B0F4F6|nr:hypothetical protein [Bradyrhizobium sp. CB82]WFU40920.1 hypothetical protein QA640_43430 [Bradyrhizobium sp. CB82]
MDAAITTATRLINIAAVCIKLWQLVAPWLKGPTHERWERLGRVDAGAGASAEKM